MKGLTRVLIVGLWLGSSTVRGEFTTVINVPPQAAPSSIGSDTQLNLADGGSLTANFAAGASDGSSSNVEVNIAGGTVGHHFSAYSGTTVNVSGGNISHRFWTFPGSTANITGGTFGPNPTFDRNSVVNIFGMNCDYELHALFRSTVNVWGGDIAFFQAHEEAEASFFGSEFHLDGVELTQLTVGQPFTIHDRDVSFSGTLADGSPFDFMLISAHPDQGGADVDHFAHEAILTVTLVPSADFNFDLAVDEQDLARWESSYGVDDLADADNDGDSDGTDFLAWQSQYTGPIGGLSAVVVIPEPASGLLLLLTSLCALVRARA